MTLKYLCGFNQSLLAQLDLAQQQATEARVTLLNSTAENEELKERNSGLENHHGVLEGSVSETRTQLLAIQKKLQSQQVKSAVLHSENRTLWKLINEFQPIASNTEQPIQQLFSRLRAQQILIERLNAERYRTGMEETSRQGCEGWVAIEDHGNDQTVESQVFAVDQS